LDLVLLHQVAGSLGLRMNQALDIAVLNGHIIAHLLDSRLGVAAAVVDLAGQLIGAGANSVAQVLVDVGLTHSQLVQLVQDGRVCKPRCNFIGSRSLSAATKSKAAAAQQGENQNPGQPAAAKSHAVVAVIVVTSHRSDIGNRKIIHEYSPFLNIYK